jgi:N-acyl amino acid synthase FeeM
MKSLAEPRVLPLPRGAGLFERIDYRLLETPEERDPVYRLRYKAYLHGGLILPSESQRVTDLHDDAPNCWIFGVYVDGELCSSLRIHVLTSECRMSYSTELYGDVLHSRLDRGEVFVDPARLAADPEKSQRYPELPYLTLRLAYLACDHFNVDTGLAMVRPDHQPFYRRVFLHEPIAEPRAFPGWHTMKTSLMASDFRHLREKVLTRFPIMRSSAFERRMLFDHGNQRKASPRPVLVSAPLSPVSAAPLTRTAVGSVG